MSDRITVNIPGEIVVEYHIGDDYVTFDRFIMAGNEVIFDNLRDMTEGLVGDDGNVTYDRKRVQNDVVRLVREGSVL